MERMARIIIRNETQADVERIAAITEAAFADHPHSSHTEQFIIAELRAAGVLTLSLVAESKGKVVGHIAFSPVSFPDHSAGWYGMGPVSVAPEHQRQGMGTALVLEGLERLRDLGARGCVLVGDPRFYERFGFQSLPQVTHEGVPQEFCLTLPFAAPIPQGAVRFHPGFTAQG
jgi:putative acetyltransferase